MNDTEFGQRLALARRRAGYRSQAALGDAVGVSGRTIRSWEAGKIPGPAELEALRTVLGQFDATGDAVEVAVRQSELHKWRQDEVIATYERHRHEQRREEAAG